MSICNHHKWIAYIAYKYEIREKLVDFEIKVFLSCRNIRVIYSYTKVSYTIKNKEIIKSHHLMLQISRIVQYIWCSLKPWLVRLMCSKSNWRILSSLWVIIIILLSSSSIYFGLNLIDPCPMIVTLIKGFWWRSFGFGTDFLISLISIDPVTFINTYEKVTSDSLIEVYTKLFWIWSNKINKFKSR